MTNPAPDFSAKVKVDSVVDSHLSFGRVTVVSAATSDRFTTDALLCPAVEATTTTTSSGMKASSSPSKGIHSKSCLLKKSEDPTIIEAKKKRKLTFLVDDKGRIAKDVFKYYFPPEVEQAECWWTDEELDQLLTEAMLVAHHYTRKQKGWQNKVKLLLKAAGGGKSKDGQPVKVKASDLDTVVDSDARGLELYIHPIFQKNRIKAVQGVIKVQAEYNASEKKKGKADPELRLKVLKAQSLKLTQTARLMAKTMADGDRRAAIKEDDEEDDNAFNEDTTNDEKAKAKPAAGNINEASFSSLIPSEELQLGSQELESRDFRHSNANLHNSFVEPLGESSRALRTRPMTHSPVRGGARPRGLQALRNQNTRLLGENSRPGAGGIGSLQIALDDLSSDEEK